jgi:methylenetetrahydrofolate reductase (NADPH)
VTASPSHGIESTIELAEQLAELGHDAVPHLSAHMIRDRAHLGALLDRCREAGCARGVRGWVMPRPGEFHDGLVLLRAMNELGHLFEAIGSPSYPEGHGDISDQRLVEVLLERRHVVHGDADVLQPRCDRQVDRRRCDARG